MRAWVSAEVIIARGRRVPLAEGEMVEGTVFVLDGENVLAVVLEESCLGHQVERDANFYGGVPEPFPEAASD